MVLSAPVHVRYPLATRINGRPPVPFIAWGGGLNGQRRREIWEKLGEGQELGGRLVLYLPGSTGRGEVWEELGEGQDAPKKGGFMTLRIFLLPSFQPDFYFSQNNLRTFK